MSIPSSEVTLSSPAERFVSPIMLSRKEVSFAEPSDAVFRALRLGSDCKKVVTIDTKRRTVLLSLSGTLSVKSEERNFSNYHTK